MNPAAILALISDLYLQITALQQRIVELEKERPVVGDEVEGGV